jgi:hypothetical protein
VPLSANSLAIGNLRYLKSAIDAAEGNGRISAAHSSRCCEIRTCSSLRQAHRSLRLQRALACSDSKTLRASRVAIRRFGNFYSAVTMTGTNFSLRGAMNADNPDTAKIINNLLSGLMQQGISAVPDKTRKRFCRDLKMTARENEIVWEADIPEKVVADFI